MNPQKGRGPEAAADEDLVQRFKRWALRNPLIAGLVILVIVIVSLGQALDPLASLWRKLRTPPDPRTFMYEGQTVRLTGGNGMTFGEAVIVDGAFNTDAGVAAEYSWLKRFYDGHRFICQALVKRGEQYFDVFVIRPGPRHVHFDVTHFYATPVSGGPVSDGDSLSTMPFVSDPQTVRQQNANECASIEGAVSGIASPYLGGTLIRTR